MTEPTTQQRLARTVHDYLETAEVEWEPGAHEGEFVVTLPGEKKLRTVVSLTARDHSLTASAFVIRHPDEDEARFYRTLLRRNLRPSGIAYAVDEMGDVYLTGRWPAAAIDADELDQILGVVLDAADSPFNELLVIGFIGSMRKEWNWRVSRGESLRNLEAFRSILQREGDPPRS